MTRLALVSDHPLPSRVDDDGIRTLRIGDLAKATHKTQRALRLYEELGLLTPGDRTSGGFRLYGREAVERVHWIGKLQELGFTLHEIQGLVQALHDEHIPKAAMAQVRGLFMQKLDDVAGAPAAPLLLGALLLAGPPACGCQGYRVVHEYKALCPTKPQP